MKGEMTGSIKDSTIRKPKDDKLNTEYGFISFEEWCQKEAKRIGHGAEYKEKGKRCWVQGRKKEEVDG